MTENTYFRDAGVPYWKCDKGDIVVFVFKPGIPFHPTHVLFGTVVRRIGSKKVIVRSYLRDQEYFLPVACVRITERAYENTAEAKEMAAKIKREAAARARHERIQEGRRKRFMAKLEAKAKPQSARMPTKVKKVKKLTTGYVGM